jgi:hypothetical protein
VKAALGQILAEPSIDGELAPFVLEVGNGAPCAEHLSRASDRIIRQAMKHYRNPPRMHLLQEVTVNRGTLDQMFWG